MLIHNTALTMRGKRPNWLLGVLIPTSYILGGEHKMENTKSHTPVALRKQIGGTMYVVRVHFNEDTKETMKDKIKRLIENDVRGTQHTA